MPAPFLQRLPHGMDLLEAITSAFRERSIDKAAFSVIGAVDRASLGFYTESRSYDTKEFMGRYEIVSCLGNLSIKDEDIFAHAHVVLSGPDYACVGGHLMPGTLIFAAELAGYSAPGDAPIREYDEETGLYLWKY
jgi:predicted DNA-binding protein with PD1-like motif